MFYPLFKLLYLISKSMFRIIDAMLMACKVLCGIQDVYIGEQPTDFLTFLLNNNKIGQGFRVSLILGIVLVCVFAIAAIIRTCVREKSEGTPGQIAVKAAKTVLEFLFVPFVMITVIGLTNQFVSAIYDATSVTDSPRLGTFLCGVFSQDGLKEDVDPLFYLEPGFDYTDTDGVFDYCQYDEFDFFFSWVAGVGIILALGAALLSFVDRAISIALLFITAPISISTAMIDDGARFKLWRDQILVKFLTGYGIIIGINIYSILINAVSSPSITLIPNFVVPDNSVVSSQFLDYLIRIAIIIGGAFSLQRIMALIGNLVQSGAGSNELREAGMAASSLGGSLKGVARGAIKGAVAPFKLARAGINFGMDAAHIGFGGAVAHALGIKADSDYKSGGSSGGSSSQGGGNQNREQPKNDSTTNVSQIISDDKKDEKKGSENKSQPKKNSGQDVVSDIIGNNVVGKKG